MWHRHADMKIIKTRFPTWGQELLKEINIKAVCYLITDGADYLKVGHRKGRVYHNSIEHLVAYVPAQIFHQLLIREPDVCLQDHKGYSKKDRICSCGPNAVQTILQLLLYTQTERPNEVCQVHSHENSFGISPEYQIL